MISRCKPRCSQHGKRAELRGQTRPRHLQRRAQIEAIFRLSVAMPLEYRAITSDNRNFLPIIVQVACFERWEKNHQRGNRSPNGHNDSTPFVISANCAELFGI
jgi:hypothetical protein